METLSDDCRSKDVFAFKLEGCYSNTQRPNTDNSSATSRSPLVGRAGRGLVPQLRQRHVDGTAEQRRRRAVELMPVRHVRVLAVDVRTNGGLPRTV